MGKTTLKLTDTLTGKTYAPAQSRPARPAARPAPSRRDNHDVYRAVKSETRLASPSGGSGGAHDLSLASPTGGGGGAHVLSLASPSGGIATPPLPAAEKGGAQFPQPRDWPAERMPARQSQTRQGGGGGAAAGEGLAHRSGSFAEAPETQRRVTDKAFRTANAFLPLDNQPPEAWDKYLDLYDTAATEEAKLHDLGGRSARELPQTIGENFGAGAVGAVRGVVNAAGYLAQRGTEAQLEENAELWRRAGREDYAADMERTRDALAPEGYESWADFGQSYLQTAAEHAAGHGKGGKLAADVARGVGGMLPSIVSNLAVPGSGLATMFLQSSGNATEEALQRGASKENAVLYGTAVGTVEVLTEKLTGGIPALGAGRLDAPVEGAIREALKSPAAQRAAISLVKNLGEGAEEFVSEFADAWLFKQLVESRDRTWKQVGHDAWYSALVGALTSGTLNLSAAGLKTASPKRLARTLADETAKRVEAGGDSPGNGNLCP